MKKLKNIKEIILLGLLAIMFFGGLATIGVSWEMYRWHTFQDEANSDIGYWKWKFVIDNNAGNHNNSK